MQMRWLPKEMGSFSNVRMLRIDFLLEKGRHCSNGVAFALISHRTAPGSEIGVCSAGQKLPEIHFGNAGALVPGAQPAKIMDTIATRQMFFENVDMSMEIRNVLNMMRGKRNNQTT